MKIQATPQTKARSYVKRMHVGGLQGDLWIWRVHGGFEGDAWRLGGTRLPGRPFGLDRERISWRPPTSTLCQQLSGYALTHSYLDCRLVELSPFLPEHLVLGFI